MESRDRTLRNDYTKFAVPWCPAFGGIDFLVRVTVLLKGYPPVTSNGVG